MIHRKIKRLFLPHFFIDPYFAAALGPKSGHHGAHGLTLTSLFLYLQVLVILTVALYTIRLTVPAILGTATFSARQIIDLTNVKRQQYGLPPLDINSQLSHAAATKAGDMFANDYWAHNSPSGKTPWSFITSADYRYLAAGENLARDFTNPEAVVTAWMNSPSHRTNLLDENFREIGVAVASGKLGGREGTLVVQMFGSRGDIGVLARNTAPQSPEQPGAEDLEEPVTVLASRKQAISKVISLAVVGAIFILLALEAAVTTKRADMQVKSGIFAHLALLGFVLLAVWYAVSGAII